MNDFIDLVQMALFILVVVAVIAAHRTDILRQRARQDERALFRARKEMVERSARKSL